MALDKVPDYLIELLRKTDPEVLARFLATGEGLTDDDVGALRHLLEHWLHDGDFWQAFGQQQPVVQPPAQDFDEILVAELPVLIQALRGDERLAEKVLVEFPSELVALRRDLQQAQQAIAQLRQQLESVQIGPRPPPASRRVLIVRKVRRVFKAAAGGVSIVGDIVLLPDPTLVLKAISISCGADMIIDAVWPHLNQ